MVVEPYKPHPGNQPITDPHTHNSTIDMLANIDVSISMAQLPYLIN